MEPKLFVAAKALIVKDGKVLLVRESSKYEEGTNIAKYGVPGGRLKPGEKIEESLAREVKEETGLDISIGDPLVVDEWRPTVRDEPWQIIGIFFKCQALTEEVVLGDDHDHFVWIDPKDEDQYQIIENERKIIKRLIQ